MIEVKKLNKYFGDQHVLKDVDASIQNGDMVAIIGPSGSGKSTFLRTLNLLEFPTNGDIIFDGVSIVDMKNPPSKLGASFRKLFAKKDIKDINQHRAKVGMVFQHFNLFNHKTILENITLAPVELGIMSKTEAEEKEMFALQEKRLKVYSQELAYWIKKMIIHPPYLEDKNNVLRL